jgi:hypothetical protein
MIKGKTVYFDFYNIFNLGGTTSSILLSTLPVPWVAGGFGSGGYLYISAAFGALCYIAPATGLLSIRVYDARNMATGSGRYARVQIFYGM